MFAPKPAVIKGALRALDAVSRLTCLPEEGKAPWNQVKDGRENYDYIILGGGSAGCVVANRLAEDPKVKVLVLEAGYSDEFMSSKTPAVYLLTIDTDTDWQFRTVPQPHAENRVMKQPRGKMLGGTSSMNAMMYHRGPASDYDEWESLGNPGWSYSECLPYFKKSEGFKDPNALQAQDQTARIAKPKYETHDPAYHGSDGPWQVSFHHLYNSAEGFIRANEQIGVQFNKDFNGESTLGVNRIQTFIQTDAVRSSLSRAFLKSKEIVPGGPEKSGGKRGTIRVVYGAHIRRVLIQTRKGVKVACGAEFVDHNNVVRQIMAVREVLLCGGAFGSPHILLASGIGPAPQAGVPHIHTLPGVGANLADHLGLAMIFRARNRCPTLHQELGYGRALSTFLQYKIRGTGGFSSQVGEAVNFVRLEDFAPEFVAREKAQGTYIERASGSKSPHFEIIFAPYYFKVHGDIMAPDTKVYYTLIALLLNPASSGTVKIGPSTNKNKKKVLTKNCPKGTAILDEMETIIDPHYLEDEWDVKCFAEAARFIRRIARKMNDDPEIGGREVHPGEAAVADTDDKALHAFARRCVETYYHPVSTCRMGPKTDPLAVVDSRLNVYGIDRLRVIDASVMPKLPAAHTCAPTVMIAERASDFIKEDYQDPVARTADPTMARFMVNPSSTPENKYAHEVKHAVDGHSQALRDLSLKARLIHSHPELGYEEVYAHQVLTDYLEVIGFKVTRSAYDIKTAFIAEYESPATATALSAGQKVHSVGFCSEYDALPGVGHACGHNLIAITGVGAALGVKAVLEKHNLVGRVRLLGTPAEETTGGKVLLIQRGAFDGLDACLMSHPGRVDSVYSTILSVGGCKVEYFGKASHASASPWEGINALDSMVMAYNGLALLRQQTIPTSRIHCIITSGGQAPNIIPDYASGRIMYRALTAVDNSKLYENIHQILESAAEANGCTFKITKEMEYLPMPHNELMAAHYTKYMEQMGVEYKPRAEQEAAPSGSTDMGNVGHYLPGLHPGFNIVSLDGATDPDISNHSHRFTEQAKTEVAHLATLRSAKGLALTGLDVLLQPGFAEAVQEDFEKHVPKDSRVLAADVNKIVSYAGGCGCH
ncbi:hypothetical protein BGZ83_000999 [Gryganskiella cystojenkinii]|nr:hypothetical protein BGZ83_000999 [Gryganskiella cystojenkinii]